MRVSVTLLDSFRYWKENEYFTEESEQQSYEELVARILGEKLPQTEAMLRGIAFHSICEEPLKYHDGDVYRCDGFEFDSLTANMLIMDLPADRVPEVKMEMQLGPVTLVGIADYMVGLDAGDMKLTKKVEHDKYAESIQWQAYLMMMDGRRFKYHAAQPQVDRRTGVIRLANYTTFPFYRCEATDTRVTRLVEEFYDFASKIVAEAA